MLEVIESKTGLPTIRLNDRLLASKVDPRREAEKWAEKMAHELHGIKAAIVLGAGAGYHLSALKAQAPHLDVIALEESREIIQFHNKSLELARFGIRLIQLDTDILANESLRKAIGSSYKVIVHPSAQLSFSKSVTAVKDYLNARTKESLVQIGQLRGLEIAENRKLKSSELISFKDVNLVDKEYEAEVSVETINHILGELTK